MGADLMGPSGHQMHAQKRRIRPVSQRPVIRADLPRGPAGLLRDLLRRGEYGHLIGPLVLHQPSGELLRPGADSPDQAQIKFFQVPRAQFLRQKRRTAPGQAAQEKSAGVPIKPAADRRPAGLHLLFAQDPVIQDIPQEEIHHGHLPGIIPLGEDSRRLVRDQDIPILKQDRKRRHTAPPAGKPLRRPAVERLRIAAIL